MRISLLLLVSLVLSARPLRAQPAADAPVPAHVAYLLDIARSGFAPVRGAPTYAPGIIVPDSALASTYPIRYQGAMAVSQLRVNSTWNVLHQTILPVAGTRAAADSAYDRVAAGIAAVIPAGWRQSRTPGNVRHTVWQECESGRGREVSLFTSLPFEAPGLYLIVYRYDSPCPGQTPAGG